MCKLKWLLRCLRESCRPLVALATLHAFIYSTVLPQAHADRNLAPRSVFLPDQPADSILMQLTVLDEYVQQHPEVRAALLETGRDLAWRAGFHYEKGRLSSSELRASQALFSSIARSTAVHPGALVRAYAKGDGLDIRPELDEAPNIVAWSRVFKTFSVLPETHRVDVTFIADRGLHDLATYTVSVPRSALDDPEQRDYAVRYLSAHLYNRLLTEGGPAIIVKTSEPAYEESLAASIRTEFKARFPRAAVYANFGRPIEIMTSNSFRLDVIRAVARSYLQKEFLPGQGLTVGVDIGGTNIKIVILQDGEILYDHSVPVNRVSGKELAEQVVELIDKALRRTQVIPEAIGMGLASVVREQPYDRPEIIRMGAFEPHWAQKRGVAIEPKNFTEDYAALNALPGILKSRFSVDTVAVINDANAFGFGEEVAQPEARPGTVVVMPLGTGAGYVKVRQGRIEDLPHQGGHMIVDMRSEKNARRDVSCGSLGCATAYISATALNELARARMERQNVEGAQVVGEAIEAAKETAQWIAVEIAALAEIDPKLERFVLSAGAMQGVTGEKMVDFVTEELKANFPDVAKQVSVSLSRTDVNWAGAVGAAKYAGWMAQTRPGRLGPGARATPEPQITVGKGVLEEVLKEVREQADAEGKKLAVVAEPHMHTFLRLNRSDYAWLPHLSGQREIHVQESTGVQTMEHVARELRQEDVTAIVVAGSGTAVDYAKFLGAHGEPHIPVIVIPTAVSTSTVFSSSSVFYLGSPGMPVERKRVSYPVIAPKHVVYDLGFIRSLLNRQDMGLIPPERINRAGAAEVLSAYTLLVDRALAVRQQKKTPLPKAVEIRLRRLAQMLEERASEIKQNTDVGWITVIYALAECALLDQAEETLKFSEGSEHVLADKLTDYVHGERVYGEILALATRLMADLQGQDKETRAELRRVMDTVGLPSDPAHIGLAREDVVRALTAVRPRPTAYTVLNVAQITDAAAQNLVSRVFGTPERAEGRYAPESAVAEEAIRATIMHIRNHVIGHLDADNLQRFMDLLRETRDAKRKVFVNAAGRSGDIGTLFLALLAEMGIEGHRIIETTRLEAITKNDLVITISGSGRTQSVVDRLHDLADRHNPPQLVSMTASPDQPPWREGRQVLIHIPGRTKFTEDPAEPARDILPLGSTFELAAHLLLESVYGTLDAPPDGDAASRIRQDMEASLQRVEQQVLRRFNQLERPTSKLVRLLKAVHAGTAVRETGDAGALFERLARWVRHGRPPSVYVLGVGRNHNLARLAATRMQNVGFNVETPAADEISHRMIEGDLAIVITRRGARDADESRLLRMMDVALDLNIPVVVVTSDPGSPAAQKATLVVPISGEEGPARGEGVSLAERRVFSLGSLSYLEGVTVGVAHSLGVEEADFKHAQPELEVSYSGSAQAAALLGAAALLSAVTWLPPLSLLQCAEALFIAGMLAACSVNMGIQAAVLSPARMSRAHAPQYPLLPLFQAARPARAGGPVAGIRDGMLFADRAALHALPPFSQRLLQTHEAAHLFFTRWGPTRKLSRRWHEFLAYAAQSSPFWGAALTAVAASPFAEGHALTLGIGMGGYAAGRALVSLLVRSARPRPHLSGDGVEDKRHVTLTELKAQHMRRASARPQTFIAASPTSRLVIRAVLEEARDKRMPVIFVASPRQVGSKESYSGFEPPSLLLHTIRRLADEVRFDGEYVVAPEHVDNDALLARLLNEGFASFLLDGSSYNDREAGNAAERFEANIQHTARWIKLIRARLGDRAGIEVQPETIGKDSVTPEELDAYLGMLDHELRSVEVTEGIGTVSFVSNSSGVFKRGIVPIDPGTVRREAEAANRFGLGLSQHGVDAQIKADLLKELRGVPFYTHVSNDFDALAVLGLQIYAPHVFLEIGELLNRIARGEKDVLTRHAQEAVEAAVTLAHLAPGQQKLPDAFVVTHGRYAMGARRIVNAIEKLDRRTQTEIVETIRRGHPTGGAQGTASYFGLLAAAGQGDGVQNVLDQFEAGTLREQEDLARSGTNPFVRRVQTDKGNFVLRRIPADTPVPALHFQDALIHRLRAEGVPAPRFLGARDGSLFAEQEGYRYTLQELMPGRPLTVERLTPGEAGRVMNMLARYHKAVWNFDPGEYVRSNEEIPLIDPLALHESEALLRTVLEEIERKAAGGQTALSPSESVLYEVSLRRETNPLSHLLAVKSKLARLNSQGLPRLIMHGDYFPFNILVNAKGEVTGILDYEFARRGPRVYDLTGLINPGVRGAPELDINEAVQLVIAYQIEADKLGIPLTDAEIASVPFMLKVRYLHGIVQRLRRLTNPAVAEADARLIEVRVKGLAALDKVDWSPLAEWSHVARGFKGRAVRMFVADWDNTAAPPKEPMPDTILEETSAWMREGRIFVVASGNPLRRLKALHADHIPPKERSAFAGRLFYLGEGGGQIARLNTSGELEVIDEISVDMDEGLKQNIESAALKVLADEKYRGLPALRVARQDAPFNYANNQPELELFLGHQSAVSLRVSKGASGYLDALTGDLAQALQNSPLRISHSGIAIDLTLVDKGEALEKLSAWVEANQKLRIPPDEVLAAGDSQVDYPLFRLRPGLALYAGTQAQEELPGDIRDSMRRTPTPGPQGLATALSIVRRVSSGHPVSRASVTRTVEGDGLTGIASNGRFSVRLGEGEMMDRILAQIMSQERMDILIHGTEAANEFVPLLRALADRYEDAGRFWSGLHLILALPEGDELGLDPIFSLLRVTLKPVSNNPRELIDLGTIQDWLSRLHGRRFVIEHLVVSYEEDLQRYTGLNPSVQITVFDLIRNLDDLKDPHRRRDPRLIPELFHAYHRMKEAA